MLHCIQMHVLITTCTCEVTMQVKRDTEKILLQVKRDKVKTILRVYVLVLRRKPTEKDMGPIVGFRRWSLC